jgi:hypothetical protein
MTLSVSMKMLDRKVQVPPDQRDIQWARQVCSASKSVHVDVWTNYPDSEYVRTNVLPLLELTRDALLAMVECSMLDQKTREIFVAESNTIDSRLVNISKNYLEGKPSALMPGDTSPETPTI